MSQTFVAQEYCATDTVGRGVDHVSTTYQFARSTGVPFSVKICHLSPLLLLLLKLMFGAQCHRTVAVPQDVSSRYEVS